MIFSLNDMEEVLAMDTCASEKRLKVRLRCCWIGGEEEEEEDEELRVDVDALAICASGETWRTR